MKIALNIPKDYEADIINHYPVVLFNNMINMLITLEKVLDKKEGMYTFDKEILNMLKEAFNNYTEINEDQPKNKVDDNEKC